MDEGAESDPRRPWSAVRAADGDRGQYDGEKPLEQIEDDIARTRMRLTAAVEALGRELAPRRLIENSAEAVRGSLDPRSDWFRDQMRAYAVPLALIATGIGWLFALRHQYWRKRLAGDPDETPAEGAETGETAAAAPIYTDVAAPPEPVPLADE